MSLERPVRVRSMTRRVSWRVFLVLIALVALIECPLAAQPVNISVYGPTIGQPTDVTAGGDGNVWFTDIEVGVVGGNMIGKITPDGVITEYAIPERGNPYGIALGADGNVWFGHSTDPHTGRIGRITPDGSFSFYGPTYAGAPTGISAGPDGNIWFTESSVPGPTWVGKITPDGMITEYGPLPVVSPRTIAAGSDGNVWFGTRDAIARITPDGMVSTYPFPQPGPSGIGRGGLTTGPDGNLWFTSGNIVGRMTLTGTYTLFGPLVYVAGGITAGPDGNLWFAAGEIGKVTLEGVITTHPQLSGPPQGITTGPDGNIWYALPVSRQIGRLSTGGGLEGAPYVALGDSFSSGEGVPPYFGETDIQGETDPDYNICHRSAGAYPAFDSLFDKDHFLACSGATTENVRLGGSAPRKGPSEAAQLDRGSIGTTTELVTITLGGNDVGFGDIIETCLDPRRQAECLDDLSPAVFGDVVSAAATGLDTVYADITSLADPATEVAVLGYPQLVAGADCPDIHGRFPLFGGLYVPVSLTPAVQDLMRAATDMLNAAIHERAAAAGLTFVSVTDHFNGHEVCGSSNQPWITGLRGELTGPRAAGVLHPNFSGQRQYFERLSACIGDNPPSNCQPTAPARQGAARQLVAVARVPQISVFPVDARPCAHFHDFVLGERIRVKGQDFSPRSRVVLSGNDHSGKEFSLGFANIDANGRLDVIVRLPTDLSTPTLVWLDVTGTGKEHTLEMIGVWGSFEIDQDGDGLPDVCDTCPAHPNNPDQRDRDLDGQGDACDRCPDDTHNQCSGAACTGDCNNDGRVRIDDLLKGIIALGSSDPLQCPSLNGADRGAAIADLIHNLFGGCPSP